VGWPPHPGYNTAAGMEERRKGFRSVVQQNARCVMRLWRVNSRKCLIGKRVTCVISVTQT